MARIEKGPQHIDIAALLCLVPKAGLEPARAWPTTPSSSDWHMPHHVKIIQLFEMLAKIAYIIF